MESIDTQVLRPIQLHDLHHLDQPKVFGVFSYNLMNEQPSLSLALTNKYLLCFQVPTKKYIECFIKHANSFM